MNTRKRITDVVPDEYPQDITPMADVLDRDLLLENIKPVETKYGDALLLTLTDEESGDTYSVITSGVVITRKLSQIDWKLDLPLIVRFVREGRWYNVI